MMYTTKNVKTKKALKLAVAAGEKIGVYSASPFASETKNGKVALEGPHYPAPHTWYATATLENGYIVKVA